MRAINVLLAILVSVGIGLLMFEGGLRLMGRGPEKTMLDFDPELGWSKKPGTSFTRKGRGGEFKVTYEINEHGLRDDPMSDTAKPAGRHRVVMLGDSFTQGWPVRRGDLFVDQLERWWQAEGRDVDVINAGTEGYSTDQAVAWFLHNAEKFQPDTAILFAYENDIYWNSQTEYVGGRQKPRFDAGGNLEERALVNTKESTLADRWAIARLFKGRSGPGEEHLFTPPGGSRPILKEFAAVMNETPAFFEDSLARTGGALKAFKAKCDELGVRGIVVPLPSHSALDPEYKKQFSKGALGVADSVWSPNKPVETFLALAGEAGLETLDPRPALEAAGGGDLFFRIDWHMNAAGNAALADFVHAELDRLGTFGASHAATAQVAMPEAPAEGGVPFALVLYLGLLALLTALYWSTYKDEPKWQPPVKVALLLGAVFGIVIGGGKVLDLVPPQMSMAILVLFVLGVLGFILYKLGHRLGTIAELIRSFVLRGHWYLMPLVVVLLTIGSLLVVAASSPLVAPFIYTLF